MQISLQLVRVLHDEADQRALRLTILHKQTLIYFKTHLITAIQIIIIYSLANIKGFAKQDVVALAGGDHSTTASRTPTTMPTPASAIHSTDGGCADACSARAAKLIPEITTPEHCRLVNIVVPHLFGDCWIVFLARVAAWEG